jgi:protein pelota
MQLIKKNLKQGEVTVKVQNPEDLWYLHQLILTDDLVSGKTERKIKIGDGEDRKQSVVKKTIFISISAEKIEFHKFSDSLRVSGKVIDGPEDVPRGSYHTFGVEPGSIITIKKDEWMKFQLEKLSEATELSRSRVLVVVFDREEAIIALLKGQEQDILVKLKGDVSKKGVEAAEKKSFYSEIIQSINEYDLRYKPDSIIVASPSFWKEYLMKEVPAELKKKIFLANCSEVGEGAITEVMRRPEVSSVLESDRASRELVLIDDVLKAIAKGEACYGVADCDEKVNIGAVKDLVVSFEFLNKCRLDNTSRHVEDMMKLCEKRGGKVNIIGTESAEKKLVGLGGVAGVLRWAAS